MFRKSLSIAIGILFGCIFIGMFLIMFGNYLWSDIAFALTEIPILILLAGVVAFIVTTMWKDNL